MRTKAVGVALHFFDAGVNSDKFYRIYVSKSATVLGSYVVISHWGRDGAPNGQNKRVEFGDFRSAKEYAEKLGGSKMRKGYEWLGEKEVDLEEDDLWYTGQRLLQATGRQPTKMDGFSMVIQEEADLLEMLS